LLVEINMQQFDGRAECINITLPRRLLVKIDAFISEHPKFSNRSVFLAEAARRVLPG
jgi:metal-responsive CopG/Arc/MetJ family transcriptional regulator